jgi:hypothetical protein
MRGLPSLFFVIYKGVYNLKLTAVYWKMIIMSNKRKANGYAVILSIAKVTILTYKNIYMFNDANLIQVIIAILLLLLLLLESILGAGALETIEKRIL